MLPALLNDKTLRVAAYACAAALAYVAGFRAWSLSRRTSRVVPLFWLATGCVLAVLALSREVDLAGHIATIGRDVFRTEGWYPDRRPVQEASVVAVLAAAAFIGAAGVFLIALRRRAQIIPGFVAVVALATFLAVRAISLHDIDAVLYRRSIRDVQVNALAELLMVICVAIAAAGAIAAQPAAPREDARDDVP